MSAVLQATQRKKSVGDIFLDMRWWCCRVWLQRGVECRRGRWELFCEINWLRAPIFCWQQREREREGEYGGDTHREKKSKASSTSLSLSLCVKKNLV